MAKKPTTDAVHFLAQFLNAPEGVGYVTKEEALQHAHHIEVNPSLINHEGKAAARLNEAGKKFLGEHMNTAKPVSDIYKPTAYAIISNAVLPASKRGNRGGGAPTKYPFDNMDIGASFFVPGSNGYDPVKKLGSTVSSANMRYAEQTGEYKEVERTKRGPRNKKVIDANGETVRELKTVPVYRHTRKVSIRAVEAGKKYGEWTAPSNGALIARVL